MFEDFGDACEQWISRESEGVFLQSCEFYSRIYEEGQVGPERSNVLFCVNKRFFDSYEDAKDFSDTGEENITTHELIRKKHTTIQKE